MVADKGDGAAARALLVDQRRLVRWQIASERAAFALRVLTSAAALAAAGALGWMVWSASQARGLVIDSFSSPPALAAKGLTGEVVATKLLDQLTLMQAQTLTARPGETYRSNWGDDIRVEIPQTGVSLTELHRYLERHLGNQTRVTGEMVQAPDGLRLTVRAEGMPADTTSGTEASLDATLAAAAGALYRRTQPYRYAGWIAQRGGYAEAIAVWEQLARTGPPGERSWAKTALCDQVADPDQGLRLCHEALQLEPNLPQALQKVGFMQRRSGRYEDALQAYRRMEAALPKAKGYGPEALQLWTPTARRFQAELLGDYSTSYAVTGGGRTLEVVVPLVRARAMALLHDVSGAEAALPPQADEVALHPQSVATNIVFVRTHIARMRGDWAAAYREATAMEAALRTWPPHRYPPSAQAQLDTNVWPLRAEALARMGRIDEAQALIGPTPLDCYPCLVTRGEIAEIAGDRAGADRWFGLAVKQGPSIPLADVGWGQVRLARGDGAGALALARRARAKSARYADAIGLEGEALLALGEPRGASQMFAQAAELTPRWGRLHLKWGEALAARGKATEAQAKWRAAARMDLTAAERAELVAVSQKRTT